METSIFRAKKTQPDAFGLFWHDTARRQGDLIFIKRTSPFGQVTSIHNPTLPERPLAYLQAARPVQSFDIRRASSINTVKRSFFDFSFHGISSLSIGNKVTIIIAMSVFTYGDRTWFRRKQKVAHGLHVFEGELILISGGSQGSCHLKQARTDREFTCHSW